MAQEKLEALMQVLVLTLQPEDKAWLVQRMQEELYCEQHPSMKADSWLQKSLDTSLRQIADGEVYSSEEAHQMMDDYVEKIYIDTFWDTRMNPENLIQYLEDID